MIFSIHPSVINETNGFTLKLVTKIDGEVTVAALVEHYKKNYFHMI